MRHILTLLFCCALAHAQTETEITVNELIKGTLFTPEKADKDTRLVIIIAGSGPTNRSGNQMGMQNNAYRMLAEALAKDGIATFSYDKRLFAQIIAGNMDEGKMLFEDGIVDAEAVIDYFKSQRRYAKIVVAGHSEGSVVGMVAARGRADGFVSIAGAGRRIDEILVEQVGKQMPGLAPDTKLVLEKLKKGETVKAPPMLQSLFRASIQPFMTSWLKYDPRAEIAKLNIPILIVNGTKDLQVPESDAVLLHQAKPDSKLVIVPNMNHIFKSIAGSEQENMASYNDPALPVEPALAAAVNQFTKSL
jgi:alpha/beta superfamily hydrolase